TGHKVAYARRELDRHQNDVDEAFVLKICRQLNDAWFAAQLVQEEALARIDLAVVLVALLPDPKPKVVEQLLIVQLVDQTAFDRNHLDDYIQILGASNVQIGALAHVAEAAPAQSAAQQVLVLALFDDHLLLQRLRVEVQTV